MPAGTRAVQLARRRRQSPVPEDLWPAGPRAGLRMRTRRRQQPGPGPAAHQRPDGQREVAQRRQSHWPASDREDLGPELADRPVPVDAVAPAQASATSRWPWNTSTRRQTSARRGKTCTGRCSIPRSSCSGIELQFRRETKEKKAPRKSAFVGLWRACRGPDVKTKQRQPRQRVAGVRTQAHRNPRFDLGRSKQCRLWTGRCVRPPVSERKGACGLCENGRKQGGGRAHRCLAGTAAEPAATASALSACKGFHELLPTTIFRHGVILPSGNSSPNRVHPSV